MSSSSPYARPLPTHSDTGEWESLIRTAREETRAAGASTPNPPLRRSALRAPSPPLTQSVAATPVKTARHAAASEGYYTEPATRAHLNQRLVNQSMATPNRVNVSSAAAASPTSAMSSPAGGAMKPYGSVSTRPTASLLHGVNYTLRALRRLAVAEREIDALRAKLHALISIRPLAEEGLNYPGWQQGQADDAMVRGGFKPGSWISSRLAATSTMFQSKLHTRHHAFTALPQEQGGGGVFVPNTFLLWLLFTNLDTSGKGYVSVEDYALFLARYCAEDTSSNAGQHQPQIQMEQYLDGDEEDSDPTQSHSHHTPYYPHSPFYHGHHPAQDGQGRNPFHAPTLGRETSLKEAQSFLSSTSSLSRYSHFRPAMPKQEEILSLFRKHDRSSHGRLGFAAFCRAMVPLLPAQGLADEYEASLAELDKPFSHYVEPSEVAQRPTTPGQRTDAQQQPAGLMARLTKEQEQVFLELLLLEIQAESQLNFAALEVQKMGQGRNPREELHGAAWRGGPPQFSEESFDLIDVYEYLDSDIDGYLSPEELRRAYDRFAMSPEPWELAYTVWRLDKDADGKMMYMDFAEILLPYAEVMPYSSEAGSSSSNQNATRYINPYHPFPWSTEARRELNEDLLKDLLKGDVDREHLTDEEKQELEEQRREATEMEEQARRAQELERKVQEKERMMKAGGGGDGGGIARPHDPPPSQQESKYPSPALSPAASPATEAKRRVSFGGVVGPSSPRREESGAGGERQYQNPQQNRTPEHSQYSQQHQQQPLSPSSFADTSHDAASYHPQQPLQYHSVHSHLFLRPPPSASAVSLSGASPVEDIVSHLTPSDLERELPAGYPFVLHPPLAPGSAATGQAQVLPMPTADPGERTMEQVRRDQLRAHQEFARQVAHQRLASRGGGHGVPSASEMYGSTSMRPASAQPSSGRPKSPHVHVKVHSPASPRGAAAVRPISPYHSTLLASTTPTLLASTQKTPPHVYAYKRADGGVEVDVWYGEDAAREEEKTSESTAGRSRSASPFVASPRSVFQAPYSLPVVYSNRATPSHTAPGVVMSPISTAPAPKQHAYQYSTPFHPSDPHPAQVISPPYPPMPAPSTAPPARFAPSYPLRFPDETLANRVHQTLYFPIPLAVPSAMLPLSEQRVPNPKLAAEITHSALVASLASAQHRMNEVKYQAEARRLEQQNRLQRLQSSLSVQQSLATSAGLTSVHAPSPIVSASNVTAVTQAIVPMQHQDTRGNYNLIGQPILQGGIGGNTSASSGIQPRIYSRPITPAASALGTAGSIGAGASINAATAHFHSTSPLVDFHHQQQLQKLALESIHAHNTILREQDAAARKATEEAKAEETRRQRTRQENELLDLQEKHAALAQEEREHKSRLLVTGFTGGARAFAPRMVSPREEKILSSPTRTARTFAKTPITPDSNAAANIASPIRSPVQQPPAAATSTPRLALLNLKDLASPTPARTGSTTRGQPPPGFSPMRPDARPQAGSPLSTAAVRNLSNSFEQSKR